MKPTHDLKRIKELIQTGQYRITLRALSDALVDFDFDAAQILVEVMALNLQDLDKTMPSEKMPDQWQDVYKKRILIGRQIRIAYIKLNIISLKGNDKAVVISFHKT